MKQSNEGGKSLYRKAEEVEEVITARLQYIYPNKRKLMRMDFQGYLDNMKSTSYITST